MTTTTFILLLILWFWFVIKTCFYYSCFIYLLFQRNKTVIDMRC